MKQLIFLAALILSTGMMAQSGEKNFIDQNYIEVNGQAEIEIVPDEIYLRIIIDEEDNKGKVALEEKERQMYKKLKQVGIDVEKDLAVQDFMSSFKDYWLKKSDIQSRKVYQLIVHDSPTLSKVFYELEKEGISNITIERTDHSEMDMYRQKVKVLAIKAAKNKAQYLAEAIDQKAGKALFIQEYGNNNYRPMMESNVMIRGLAKDKGLATPEIEFQKIKLEASVMARFALE